jgi:hypothetical protein
MLDPLEQVLHSLHTNTYTLYLGICLITRGEKGV